VETFATPRTVRDWSDRCHTTGASIGLVPTMGALHDGHLALVDVARSRCDLVVVSVFVNPLQFDRPDDFDSYPRPLDHDLDQCRALGVDAVYVPTAAALYPDGFDTHVEPGRLADQFEGEHRPGHFRGVATVVAKLLGAVRPDVAVFGEKDAQQLAVIRRLVADLDLGAEVVGVATVREPDGLARSSRNERLDEASRTAARCIPAALDAASRLLEERPGDLPDVAEVEAIVLERLRAEPRAEVEYAAVVDERTFTPAGHLDQHARLVVAVWIGGVRLIDNVHLLDTEVVRRVGR
jgi:pantoate--beta-alanine ligase